MVMVIAISTGVSTERLEYAPATSIMDTIMRKKMQYHYHHGKMLDLPERYLVVCGIVVNEKYNSAAGLLTAKW